MASTTPTTTRPAAEGTGKAESTSSRRLQYRPKPYRTLQQIAEDSKKARAERNSKENVPPSTGIGSGWLSSRRTPDFHLDPVKDAPTSSQCKAGPSLLRPFKEKRYCCIDCYKWYHGDPRCSSGEVEAHIQHTARHRQPRGNTPPGQWDIDFPDSD